MRHMRKAFVGLGLLLELAVWVWAGAAVSSQATVMEIRGEARVLKAGTSDWIAAKDGMILKEGDALKTGPQSEVRLELLGAAKTAQLMVRKDSQFTFTTFRHDLERKVDTTLLEVEFGNVFVKAEKLAGDSTFEVKTPTSIVGIRGTTFEVNVSKS